MTVREWFRIQRGQLWARGDLLAPDIDRIAAAITTGSQPDRWVRIGSLYWVESVQRYLEQERVFALVKADMDAAMNRLCHAKDLT